VGIHRKTNQRVAIKIIKPSVSDKQKLSKIKQEAKILSSFNHPHILRVYEFIQSEEGLFIVMEYLPGGELYDLIINKGKFSEEDSRLIFQQLICALDYCHHHGVAHRDIKPENILLDEQNNIKLGDFGLSNYFHDGAFLNTKCGSLNYAAPELLEGKKYCGPEIDVWSSGVVLYVLVTGCLPFDENQVATLTLKIKNADYSVPLSVSLICKDLISRMLNPDPLHRITVGQIRHHPWFNTKLPNHLNFGVNCLDKDEVFSLCEIKPRSSLKLDQEIFNKCTQLHLCPDYSEDRLKRRLSKQKQDAFCVAYRMLQDQKQKEKIKELNQKSLEITPAFTSPEKKKKSPKSKTRSSISKIQNSSKPQSTVFKFQDFEVHQLFSPHNWTYGFRALKSTQDFYSLFMKSCEELQMVKND
jgi:5'-AMP-activated protein kinase catalytic alpha subunit